MNLTTENTESTETELLVALEQCVPLIIAHANHSGGEGVSTLQVARAAIARAKRNQDSNYTPNNHWLPMSVEPPKEEALLLHFGSLVIETGYLDENNDWRLCSTNCHADEPMHWSDFTPPPAK